MGIDWEAAVAEAEEMEEPGSSVSTGIVVRWQRPNRPQISEKRRARRDVEESQKNQVGVTLYFVDSSGEWFAELTMNPIVESKI